MTMPEIFQRFGQGEFRRDAFKQVRDAICNGANGAGLDGVEDAAAMVALAFFSGGKIARPDSPGHVLLTGTQGTGKSELAQNVAAAVGQEKLRRVQGTPDLTPRDLLGADSLLEEGGRTRISFTPGDLFGDRFDQNPLEGTAVLLFDEVNRVPSRTHAALLQVMGQGEARIVTNDPNLQSHKDRELLGLMILATRNPETHVGTDPIPEALLDRFRIELWSGHAQSIAKVLEVGGCGRNHRSNGDPWRTRREVAKVQTPDRTLKAIDRIWLSTWSDAAATRLAPDLRPRLSRDREIVELAGAIEQGASVRGAIAILEMGCALAWAETSCDASGVTVETRHVYTVAEACLRHRIALTAIAQAEGLRSEFVVARLLDRLWATEPKA